MLKWVAGKQKRHKYVIQLCWFCHMLPTFHMLPSESMRKSLYLDSEWIQCTITYICREYMNAIYSTKLTFLTNEWNQCTVTHVCGEYRHGYALLQSQYSFSTVQFLCIVLQIDCTTWIWCGRQKMFYILINSQAIGLFFLIVIWGWLMVVTLMFLTLCPKNIKDKSLKAWLLEKRYIQVCMNLNMHWNKLIELQKMSLIPKLTRVCLHRLER